MAIAVHPGYQTARIKFGRADGKHKLTARTRELHPAEAPKSFRLPQHHREVLSDIAHGVEETDAGICTRYLLDHVNGSDGEVHLHDIERFCDLHEVLDHEAVNTWRSRMRRARRALNVMRESMRHDEIAILHIAYGPEDPLTREWTKSVRDHFGRELTGLVRYTDAVEERRKKLVRAELVAYAHDYAMNIIVTQGLREPAQLVDFRRIQEREQYFDRIVSSTDAMRAALAPVENPLRGKNESPHDHAERIASHNARRISFIIEAKKEADRMLVRASRAYHEAWLASAS